MVEKHYGHLAPSFIADAIKAGAPRYRVRGEKQVVPLRSYGRRAEQDHSKASGSADGLKLTKSTDDAGRKVS